MTAGHCAACEGAIWVIFVDPKTQQEHLGWPHPDSVYVVVETVLGPAPGIGFHAGCAPAPGEPIGVDLAVRATGAAGPVTVAPATAVVRDHQPAGVRYRAWFDPWYGTWLAAWLHDHLCLAEGDAAPILAAWHRDVQLVKGSEHGDDDDDPS